MGGCLTDTPGSGTITTQVFFDPNWATNRFINGNAVPDSDFIEFLTDKYEAEALGIIYNINFFPYILKKGTETVDNKL